MSTSVFCSIVVDFITFLTVHSRYRIKHLVHNMYNWRLVFLVIWYKCQQQAAPHNDVATSLQPQIFILEHADKRSGTSLVSGAATGPVSITEKHSQNHKIKYLIIFQVMDSEVPKQNVRFSMSCFKKILSILHSMCYIDLHYLNWKRVT